MSATPTPCQATVCLPSLDLDADIRFLVDEVGLALRCIFPADSPRVAELEGLGLALRLERADAPASGPTRLLLRAPGEAARRVRSPGGIEVQWQDLAEPLAAPLMSRPRFTLQRRQADAAFETGRAGLRYRDLVPDRHGGAVIASHIQVLDGGPVPDYVHFHELRFQIIFCRRGWVRVVYEDQGPPFVMEAGDCVLQPPTIRHRVLESSAGAEVIEVCAPAEHLTRVDAQLALPTADVRPQRHFGGQTFVHHQAAQARWQAWLDPAFEACPTGIATASAGAGDVRVLRLTGGSLAATDWLAHAHDLCLYVVLDGELEIDVEGEGERLRLMADDCCTLGSGQRYRLRAVSGEVRVLWVGLPGVIGEEGSET